MDPKIVEDNRPMRTLIALIILFMVTDGACAYEREDYEESAGSSFSFLMNPDAGIYGVSMGSGTWLKNAPIFGDYFIRYLVSDIEDATYTGAGLTLRLMPRWALAPFIGAGGSYNYRLSVLSAYQEESSTLKYMGDSYWGGHVECGFRLWMVNKVQLLEFMGRYTVSSSGDGHEYWLASIATGTGF